MIDSEDMASGHALSRSGQPFGNDLIKLVLDESKFITFVLGGGLSINSGLPTWTALLDSVRKVIANPAYQEFIAKDVSDTLRKSEYIIELATTTTVSDENAIIRDALYRSSGSPEPGELHTAVAKLLQILGGRARVITTNYDTLLETALSKLDSTLPVVSSGPKDIDRWVSEASPNPYDVLHVHGILQPRVAATDEVVFTESHFLRSGPRVQQAILSRLKQDVVIFLGVSLTDPNLTAPLWTYAHSSPSMDGVPYVLSVPTVLDHSRLRESYEFEIAKASFLESKLQTRPIFLKSYSQLAQYLWELRVELITARSSPKRRRIRPYGDRFSGVLNSCYQKVGASFGSDQLDWANAQALSDRMNGLLDSAASLGSLLADAQLKYPLVGGAEQFGIFLWLRVRAHDKRPAPYAIRLVGTSAYVRRDAFRNLEVEMIRPTSKFPAASAVYYGSSLVRNLDASGPSSIWRGVLAHPLRVETKKDVMTVGALTLNTTAAIFTDKLHEDERSVLARVKSDKELRAIIVAAEDGARSLLR